MAENLGEAQLRLTVDLTAFQDDLRRARDLISRELGNVTRTNREAQTTARRVRTEADEQRRRIDRAARQGGARESTRALEIAQEKRFRIARRIDTLEEQGANVARLRLSLGRLTDAQIRRQFGSFRQLGQELARQVTLEERRFQALRRQQRQQQLAAAVGAQQGGARESIFALERAQDKRFKLSQRINRLEEQGTNVSQLRARLGDLTTSYAQRQFGTARQLSRELERQVALTEARARRERDVQRALERSAKIGGAREPVQGRADLVGSPRFLEEQRRREQQALRRAAQLGGAAEPVQGRVGIEGSPRFLQEQARRRQQLLDRGAQLGGAAESIANFERLLQQRFRLTQRVNALDAQGVQTAGLRNQLNRLDAAFANQQFGSAKRLTTELGRQLDFRQAQLRIARDQQRLGGPSEPIRGRVDLPGSPRFIEAQRAAEAAALREAQRAGGPSLPVTGRLINGGVVPGSPADRAQQAKFAQSGRVLSGASESLSGFNQLLNKRSDLTQKIGALEAKGLTTTQLRNKLNSIEVALQNQQLGSAKQLTAELERTLRVKQSQLQIEKQLRQGPSLPVSGRLINGQVVPGSPADLARRGGGGASKKKQQQAALGDALIGGAFPLLFGQGLGASLGGAAGGFAGGKLGGNFGFGLSLAGTAIGSQFDVASQKLQALGGALNDPIGKFGELQQAGLLSSKGLERQIQALIDTGRQAEAAALIQKDLATTYGDLQAAQGLARQSDELNRAWTRLTVTLADIGIAPLVSLLSETSNAVQGFAVAIKTLRDVLPNLPTPFGTPKEIGQGLTSQGGLVGGAARFAGDYAKNFQRVLFSNALLPGSGLDTVLRLGSGLGQVFGANKPATPAATAANEANAKAATKARQELLTITRQLIASEAQNNTALTTGLKLRQSQVQEAQALANVTEKDPKARQIRIEEIRRAAQQERDQLREQAKAAFDTSNREYVRQQQLVGVYGTQRQIKEEELKLVEARRVADQAQAAFNKSSTKDAAEANRLNEAILKRRITELQVTENIRRLEAERWANAIAASNQLQQTQDQTAIELARPGLTGIGVGALQSLAAFKAARQAEQVAQARLRVEPGNESLQQAAKQASDDVVAAAAKTRADLAEAFQNAKDAVQAIGRSIEDAVLALDQAQNTSGQGVNEFLSAQQVTNRQQQIEQARIPVLQRLVDEFARRTGIQPNFQISGTLEQRNATRSRGIAAFRQELRQQEDLQRTQREYDKAQRDLVAATKARDEFGRQLAQNRLDLATGTGDSAAIMKTLATSTVDLAEQNKALEGVVKALSDKNWQVYVNVPGGSAYGDVLPPASN